MKGTLPRRMLVIALLATTLPRCSRSSGTVSGKVTFQRHPVAAGSVTFIHADGPMRSGSIYEGSSWVAKIPTGAWAGQNRSEIRPRS
jgi:hypothetical protein